MMFVCLVYLVIHIPEIKEHCLNVPYILVGSKKDLRDAFSEDFDKYPSLISKKPIPTQDGKKMAKEIKADDYFETDLYDKNSIQNIFMSAIKAALRKKRELQPTNELIESNQNMKQENIKSLL